jgi:hypothetical protein
MDRGRQTTSTQKTDELRFDDPDFLEALAADYATEETPARPARPLARALGVADATEYDFDYLIDAGVCLTVKTGRTADQAAGVYDKARRDKGDGVLVASIQRAAFSSWVLAVTCDDEAQAPTYAPPGLSSRKESEREAAFGALPDWLADVYLVRVRVHEETASQPPKRDPAKMAPKGQAASYSPDTIDS